MAKQSHPRFLQARLTELLAGYTFNIVNERDLQDAVEQILTEQNIEYTREAKLNKTDRIDFLCGTVGLEIKVGCSFAEVVRQLHRYAQCDEISALVLMTTRLLHTMPKNIMHSLSQTTARTG